VGFALGVLACTAAPTPTVQEQQHVGVREDRLIRQYFTMLRDRIVISYVRELGTKLSESTPTLFPLSFYILEDAVPCGFAVPGGSIYVSTGTLLEVRNPDELAGVLAHVIGHVAAHHESLQYQQAGNRPGAFAAPFSAKAEREANDLA
jgi:predicted Zn-dependent protease